MNERETPPTSVMDEMLRLLREQGMALTELKTASEMDDAVLQRLQEKGINVWISSQALKWMLDLFASALLDDDGASSSGEPDDSWLKNLKSEE